MSSGAAVPTTVLYLDHTAKLSGGEIALARMLEAIDRRQVTPVALLGEDGPLVARLRALDVETHVLPLATRVRDIRKDTLSLGALRYAGRILPLAAYSLRVARFARRRGAHILHTNSLKSDLYGALAGRLAGIPVVWHVRDFIDPSYLPLPAVRLFRFLARWLPSYVVTNSQSTLDRLSVLGARPSSVVPSGITERDAVIHDGLGRDDLGPEARVRARELRGAGLARVGIVGRITRWKGQHIFLDAAARVCAAGHAAEFLIVGAPLFGEEGYEAELRRQAESLGIASRVKFLGFQQDVRAVLSGLDVLVHASITPEPFGQVIIEGMAEGVPVIATAGGGVLEIVTHGENGLLVPMGDAEALARELGGLLSDPARAQRLGRAGREHVQRHFTAAQSARKIERVYAEMRKPRTRNAAAMSVRAAEEGSRR